MNCRRALIAAAALGLAACSSGGNPAGSAGSPTSVSPLTGQAVAGTLPDRPVLVVKVDNTPAARPQVGLSAADLVVEELVEGGLTRLAVMYYAKLPDQVVPVRSVRTSDIGIVAPTGGALIASGGASRVLRAVHGAGVVVLTQGAAGFSRDSARPSPYNLVVAPEETLTEVPDLGPPVHPYLPWASAGTAQASGAPASAASIRFSPAHTTNWDWTGDGWHRRDELAPKGDEFTPDNLLVLRVTTRDAGYRDPAGNPVPETILTGSGDALLLTGGHAVRARWSKSDANSPLTLADTAGDALRVPPGKTWIELVPTSGDVTVS